MPVAGREPQPAGQRGPLHRRQHRRHAGGLRLDKISQTQYPLTGDLSTAKLAANDRHHPQHAALDPRTLLPVTTSSRSCATTTSSVRSVSTGTTSTALYRETMLAPRELNIAGLPTQSQTWVNQHLTYTHGFGGRGLGGQPGHLRRLARLPRAGRAAHLERPRPRHHPAAHLLRLAGHQLHAGRHQDPEFDYRAAPVAATSTPTTRAAAASPSTRPSTGSPSPCVSARSGSSSPNRSILPAASSSATTSSPACMRRRRS